MKDTRVIALNGIIAAIYVTFTIIFAPLSFGPIQFRFAEALMLLAFYNKKFIPGLILGCVISNFYSDLGVWDWTLGNLSTVIVVFIYWFSKNKYLATIINSLVIGIIIALNLYMAFGEPYFMAVITVAGGELAVLLLGCLIFKYAEKNEALMSYIINEKKFNV